jgi:hypothetical protein
MYPMSNGTTVNDELQRMLTESVVVHSDICLEDQRKSMESLSQEGQLLLRNSKQKPIEYTADLVASLL